MDLFWCNAWHAWQQIIKFELFVLSCNLSSFLIKSLPMPIIVKEHMLCKKFLRDQVLLLPWSSKVLFPFFYFVKSKAIRKKKKVPGIIIEYNPPNWPDKFLDKQKKHKMK